MGKMARREERSKGVLKKEGRKVKRGKGQGGENDVKTGTRYISLDK